MQNGKQLEMIDNCVMTDNGKLHTMGNEKQLISSRWLTMWNGRQLEMIDYGEWWW